VPASTRRRPRPVRQVGYVTAAIANLVLLWAASRVDEWFRGLFDPRYDEVVPWVQASLVATVVANVTWVVHDGRAWRHLGQAGLHVLSLAVATKVWDVFPFDVGALARLGLRTLLVVWIVGTVVGLAAELRGLGRWSSPRRRALT